MAIVNQTHDPGKVPRFLGLSTDTKPVDNTTIGATFYETDTKHEYIYADDWVPTKQVTVEQVAPVIVEEVPTTDELLGEILTQLKVQNAHLALITGEEELNGTVD